MHILYCEKRVGKTDFVIRDGLQFPRKPSIRIQVNSFYFFSFRRSQLKRVQEAIRDYERVLELEPKNKQARLELEKLRKVKEKDESANTILVKKPGEDFGHNIRVGH